MVQWSNAKRNGNPLLRRTAPYCLALLEMQMLEPNSFRHAESSRPIADQRLWNHRFDSTRTRVNH